MKFFFPMIKKTNDYIIETARNFFPTFFKITQFDRRLIIGIVIVGIFYVGNTFSPSSYAIVLDQFHVKNNGLILGSPRDIREDEWGDLTPFTQSTVNNHFERYNRTSFYGEDLRMYYSMPIFDWGMIFKPTMWAYLIIPPAYAYSFYWYALMVLFIVGYALLFRKFTPSRPKALLLSFILFFTGFTQYWWSSIAPVVAFFPWLLIVLDAKYVILLRSVLFYWVATSWIVGDFYPPIIISLAFTCLVFLCTSYFKNFSFRKDILYVVISSFAVLSTVFLYLKDYILANLSTLYPGLRIMDGGAIDWKLWLAQFFPTGLIVNHASLLTAENICGISVVGTYYFLCVICFLEYSKIRTCKDLNKIVINFIPVVILLVAMNIWMLFPIPSWIGGFVLWDRIPGERMAFAVGLLLITLMFLITEKVGMVITWWRYFLFFIIVMLGTVYFKIHLFHIDLLASWKDWIIVVPVAVVLYMKQYIGKIDIHTTLIAICAIVGFFAFGAFNPIQSTKPIFNREATDVTRILDRARDTSRDGVIAFNLFRGAGAVLNGLGYKSVTHIQGEPNLFFWSSLFPELPPSELNQIFNRFAVIVLIDEQRPKLLGPTVIGIPDAVVRKKFKLNSNEK